MKKTMILALGLAFILINVTAATAQETTSTTLGTSTTTTSTSTTTSITTESTTTGSSTTTLSLITPEATTTTTLATSAATTAAPAAPTPSIKPSVKSKLLNDINLLLDTAGNYRMDRFLLSSNYSTYVKLIRDNKGKESSTTKSLWSDIYKLDKRTLPEHEAQLDKLIRELRNYVQNLD